MEHLISTIKLICLLAFNHGGDGASIYLSLMYRVLWFDNLCVDKFVELREECKKHRKVYCLNAWFGLFMSKQDVFNCPWLAEN